MWYVTQLRLPGSPDEELLDMLGSLTTKLRAGDLLILIDPTDDGSAESLRLLYEWLSLWAEKGVVLLLRLGEYDAKLARLPLTCIPAVSSRPPPDGPAPPASSQPDAPLYISKLPPLRHVVTAKDTWPGIALRYGVTISTIKKRNNIISDQLPIGVELIIPVEPSLPIPLPDSDALSSPSSSPSNRTSLSFNQSTDPSSHQTSSISHTSDQTSSISHTSDQISSSSQLTSSNSVPARTQSPDLASSLSSSSSSSPPASPPSTTPPAALHTSASLPMMLSSPSSPPMTIEPAVSSRCSSRNDRRRHSGFGSESGFFNKLKSPSRTDRDSRRGSALFSMSMFGLDSTDKDTTSPARSSSLSLSSQPSSSSSSSQPSSSSSSSQPSSNQPSSNQSSSNQSSSNQPTPNQPSSSSSASSLRAIFSSISRSTPHIRSQPVLLTAAEPEQRQTTDTSSLPAEAPPPAPPQRQTINALPSPSPSPLPPTSASTPALPQRSRSRSMSLKDVVSMATSPVRRSVPASVDCRLVHDFVHTQTEVLDYVYDARGSECVLRLNQDVIFSLNSQHRLGRYVKAKSIDWATGVFLRYCRDKYLSPRKFRIHVVVSQARHARGLARRFGGELSICSIIAAHAGSDAVEFFEIAPPIARGRVLCFDPPSGEVPDDQLFDCQFFPTPLHSRVQQKELLDLGSNLLNAESMQERDARWLAELRRLAGTDTDTDNDDTTASQHDSEGDESLDRRRRRRCRRLHDELRAFLNESKSGRVFLAFVESWCIYAYLLISAERLPRDSSAVQAAHELQLTLAHHIESLQRFLDTFAELLTVLTGVEEQLVETAVHEAVFTPAFNDVLVEVYRTRYGEQALKISSTVREHRHFMTPQFAGVEDPRFFLDVNSILVERLARADAVSSFLRDATAEMRRLGEETLPARKTRVVLRTVEIISDGVAAAGGVLSADLLLPLLVFVLFRSDIAQLVSHVWITCDFCPSHLRSGATSYAVFQLQTALAAIETLFSSTPGQHTKTAQAAHPNPPVIFCRDAALPGHATSLVLSPVSTHFSVATKAGTILRGIYDLDTLLFETLPADADAAKLQLAAVADALLVCARSGQHGGAVTLSCHAHSSVRPPLSDAVVTPHRHSVTVMLALPEHGALLVADRAGLLSLWRVTAAPQLLAELNSERRVTAACYCPHDRRVWCGGQDAVRLLSVDGCALRFDDAELTADAKIVAMAAPKFSPGVWTTAADGSLVVWHARQRTQAWRLVDRSDDELASIVASNVLPALWTGSSRGAICMWSVPSCIDTPPTVLYSFAPHERTVKALCLREYQMFMSVTLFSLDRRSMKVWQIEVD